jgi:hypothetical protein
MTQKDEHIALITRRAIWDGMLDAARMARYADAMEQRYAKQRKWVRIVLSLAASGGIVTFMSELPRVASLGFGFAVGVAVAADFAMDYSAKLAKLMYTKMECSALLSEWQALWLDVETHRCEEDESRRRNDKLLERLTRTTAPMASEMHTDPSVNKETTEGAYSDIALRFTDRRLQHP